MPPATRGIGRSAARCRKNVERAHGGFAGRSPEPHGEAAAAPWEFTWEKLNPGVHPVYARWIGGDDKPGVTNPALFRVRSR